MVNRPARSHTSYSIPDLLNSWLKPIILLIFLALVIQACGSPAVPGGSKPGTALPEGASSGSSSIDELDQAMTLDQALNTMLEDNRTQILEQMGPPDVFRITFEGLNGKQVRQEEWSYFDDQTRFDFINGTLVSTIEINSVPDMSVNASTYNPLNFSDGMTVEEVQTLLDDQQVTQVDLADYGVPAGQVLAGNQILLGFDEGKLVYVRTFELVPEVTQ
jgi:hypothetical protein